MSYIYDISRLRVKHHSIPSLLNSSCSNKWLRVDVRESNFFGLRCIPYWWQMLLKLRFKSRDFLSVVMRDDINPTLSGNEWTYSINLVKHHSIPSLLNSSCSNKWLRVDVRETNLDCTESSWQSRRKNFSPSLTPFLFNSLLASHSPLEGFFFFGANRTVFNLYFYCSNTLPFFSLTVSLPHPTS